jgi:hypothetical protein
VKIGWQRLATPILAGLVLGVTRAPAAQTAAAGGAVAQQQSRYQVAQMERALEGAVEHGAAVTRDRLQSLVPATMLLRENARVRGFRLDGYGVFFDVEVPSLQGTLPWSFRTLDQNDLGIESALKALRAHIEAANDSNLDQALKRVELQVGPVVPAAVQTRAGTTDGARRAVSTAPEAPVTPESMRIDPILLDPEEAYRTEVKQALMDAMLDYGGPLAVGSDEWLTVAARRNDDRPRLAPADSDALTIVIRARGSDLVAFRTGRASRDEVLKRMEVRVF